MHGNMEKEKDPKYTLRLFFLYTTMYFFIVIFPYIIFGFERGLGLVSVPDLIDLICYPPIFGILLIAIYESVKSEKQPKYIKYTAFFALILHFEGHGFHWAANAIDVLIYGNKSIPTEIANFAYFLDEILSHKIMFSGILFFFFILFVVDIKYNEYSEHNPLLGGLLGATQGLLFTIAFIEGQFIIDAIFIVAFFIATMLLIYRNNIFEAKNKPMCQYVLAMLISMYMWTTLYILIFGGLYQPSEIF